MLKVYLFQIQMIWSIREGIDRTSAIEVYITHEIWKAFAIRSDRQSKSLKGTRRWL